MQLDLFLKEETQKEKNESKHFSPDLNPFLGPKTRPIGYLKYIKSIEWENKRKFALNQRGNRCEKCYSRNKLEVHHIHYNTLYHERLNDVEVLCKRCHPGADASREHRTAYETYAFKKYGEDYWKYDSEYLQDEFDQWLESKEREDNRW